MRPRTGRCSGAGNDGAGRRPSRSPCRPGRRAPRRSSRGGPSDGSRASGPPGGPGRRARASRRSRARPGTVLPSSMTRRRRTLLLASSRDRVHHDDRAIAASAPGDRNHLGGEPTPRGTRPRRPCCPRRPTSCPTWTRRVPGAPGPARGTPYLVNFGERGARRAVTRCRGSSPRTRRRSRPVPRRRHPGPARRGARLHGGVRDDVPERVRHRRRDQDIAGSLRPAGHGVLPRGRHARVRVDGPIQPDVLEEHLRAIAG